MLTRAAALALACVALLAPRPVRAGERRLTLTALEREPAEARAEITAEHLEELRQAAAENPRDRGHRFRLVRALMQAGDLPAALAEARAWRDRDAYNLVVVRLLGDIYARMGDAARARRTYSAVVELLPRDAQAQRALGTVLKQSGDLAGARDRLAEAAAASPGDARIAFELADVVHRAGDLDEAQTRFEAIVADAATPEAVRHPARQRLAQIYLARRRAALAGGDRAEAERLAGRVAALGVEGGAENDVKIYLSWDTDHSDVDLWVTAPSGEKIYYQHKQGAGGEALFDDVTTGYGPESFTARTARPGTYLVQVNYFESGRTALPEACGEVVVILGEGTAVEKRHVLPYRLYAKGQTVTVARIDVR